MNLRLVIGYGPEGSDAVEVLYVGYDGEAAEAVLFAENEEYPRREYIVRPQPVKRRVDPTKEEIERAKQQLVDEAAAAEAEAEAKRVASIDPVADLVKERDELAAHADALTEDRNAIAAERDDLAAHADALNEDRNAIAAARDAAVAERDALAAKVKELEDAASAPPVDAPPAPPVDAPPAPAEKPEKKK